MPALWGVRSRRQAPPGAKLKTQGVGFVGRRRQCSPPATRRRPRTAERHLPPGVPGVGGCGIPDADFEFCAVPGGEWDV